MNGVSWWSGRTGNGLLLSYSERGKVDPLGNCQAADNLASSSGLTDVKTTSYNHVLQIHVLQSQSQAVLLKVLLSHRVFFRKWVKHPSRHSREILAVHPWSQVLGWAWTIVRSLTRWVTFQKPLTFLPQTLNTGEKSDVTMAWNFTQVRGIYIWILGSCH